MTDHCIVVNRDAFSEDFTPEIVVSRKHEINLIMHCLYPATKGRKPLHVWIYGDSGSGKTLIARFCLARIKREYPRIQVEYINCWENDTLYKVVATIVYDLRILGADQQDTIIKLTRIERHLKDQPFLVVLDEINRIKPREREAIIYILCNLGNIGLICISRNEDTFYNLQQAIRSRMNPQFVKCERYSVKSLSDILHHRANISLENGTCPEKIISRVASQSKGDARIAIQVLRNAAEWAEHERSPQVRLQHVSAVWNKVNQLPRESLLASLTQDHRMLYDIVREEDQVLSGQLWDLYVKNCAKTNRNPIALRTISNYVNHLVHAGLINCERARVKGKVRLLSLAGEGM